jgi:hypothetical protein
MSFTRVLDKPLLIMFVLETLLVVGLGAAAWAVWQSRQEAPRSAPAPSAAAPGEAGSRPPKLSPGQSPPPSASPPPKGSAPGPTPGFRTDADFLVRQLRDVNRDQAALEDIEWRLVKGAMQGVKSYIEKVVVPAVERAERSTR